ncbi:MAG: L,D-transpeptidase family protein [Marinobacter sp.]
MKFLPRRAVMFGALALALSACSNKFRTYNGPEVTRVAVFKGRREMYLLHREEVLKKYDIDLGFTPVGHKFQEGDGRTPEGRYLINRRNPNSLFYLSIGISYPNEADVARAKAFDVSPGGDIFIHGGPRKGRDRGGKDWTAGCISVSDRQMEDIYAMVRDGTLIDIYP